MTSARPSISRRPGTATFDVYSYGVVSSSTLYTLKDGFPGVEGYAEIESVQHMTGGEAANSSIVLARLGVRVRLDGNRIGDDDGGKRTRDLLDRFGIDASRLPLTPGHAGVSEVVFAARDTRTIFGTYGRMLDDEDWNIPDKSDIAGASVICLDPFFGAASAQVARYGAEAGIPVVTVDCRYDDPLVGDSAAVVIAESFIRSGYPDRSPEELFEEYRRSAGGLVVFTFGDRPGWYGRLGDAVATVASYPVAAVDTSGAGDSFRAGVVFGLLNEWDDARTMDFAAALAAIVCTRSPGVLRAPGYEEVVEFMRKKKARRSGPAR